MTIVRIHYIVEKNFYFRTKVRQAYLSHSGIAKSEHNIHFILPAYKDSLSGLGSSNAN